MSHNEIYEQRFLERLFDQMQNFYGVISNISSFGFSRRWRRQLIEQVDIKPGQVVCDLMTGTGETWRYLLPKIGKRGRLISIDFSAQMIKKAQNRKSKFQHYSIDLLQENVLTNTLSNASVDWVVCSYGVKTLGKENCRAFVAQIQRVLRPGGKAAFVEVSIPSNRFLRFVYFNYVHYIIPMISRAFLANHENYKMLSTYLVSFKNSNELAEIFEQFEFEVHKISFFFGCATGMIVLKK